MIQTSFADIVLNPLLSLNPLIVIALLSFILALVINILYKFLTNQALMKGLKEEMKEYQKRIRKEKGNPAEMARLQKLAMSANMKYMMQSMRPTLITFLPAILLIGWFSAHLSVDTIMPNQEFTSTLTFDADVLGNVTAVPPENLTVVGESTRQIESSKAVFRFQALEEGDYLLKYRLVDSEFTKDVYVTNQQGLHATVQENVNRDGVKTITIDHKKKTYFTIPGFNYNAGWLLTYFILVSVFSLGLRRIMKLH